MQGISCLAEEQFAFQEYNLGKLRHRWVEEYNLGKLRHRWVDSTKNGS